MAPTTRRNPYKSPPPEPLHGKEADTIRKDRFFDALDNNPEGKSQRQIAEDLGISESCGRKWKEQRKNMGSIARRSTRKRSTIDGRPSKVTKSMCKILVSPTRNPHRRRRYEAQIAIHNIPVKKRQLQAQLKEHTNGGQRYKCAFVKKVVSGKNQDERVDYGEEHKDKPLIGFWDHILFTDEAHVDPSSLIQEEVLRELGKRYDTENIQERGQKQGVKFHVAGWINWYEKAKKLEFYNDENDHTEQPPPPPKPRRRPTTETLAEYKTRLREWDALKPHAVEVKVKGNAMTQKYYTERLLPIYVQAVKDRAQYSQGEWPLQEDRDPSHGMRKEGLAQLYRVEHNVKNLKHPVQSPDLNPIEAIWNIIKQRLRRRIFDIEEDIKVALQEEWDKVTMQEIRDRISDMPGRCKTLTRNEGKSIKTAKW